MKKFMASAAASKAGPRLAEVAGSDRRSRFELFAADGIKVVRSGFFRLLEGSGYGFEGGIQNEWRMPQAGERGILFSFRRSGKEPGTMEINGEVRIFQQIPSQHQHDGFFGLYEFLLHQFLEPGQSNG